MKTLTATTLALLMALSAPALAKPASCEQIADVAESVMDAHQNGVSMATMMGITKGNALIEKMTVEAYEVGRYRVEANQQREIADFRDKWYLACYKEFQ